MLTVFISDFNSSSEFSIFKMFLSEHVFFHNEGSQMIFPMDVLVQNWHAQTGTAELPAHQSHFHTGTLQGCPGSELQGQEEISSEKAAPADARND